MATIREELIQLAITDIQQGLCSIRSAAEKYSVPSSTLSDRLHGSQPQRQAKTHNQRLSPVQEEYVVDWCLNEEKSGRAPSRSQVVGFAQAILAEGGDRQPLGARWIDRFLRRHNAVKTKKSALLESSRTKGSTREAYQAFYRRLEFHIRDKNIIPANIANVDEHGMQEMETTAGTVIGSSLTRRAYTTSSDTTTWVTVIECGTAEGVRLSPTIVFTGASLQGQWFPPKAELEVDFLDWKFDYSLTGWSNSQIVLKWLKEVYLPQTQPQGDEWRLLILDEHSSHTTGDFMATAWLNKVQLVYLPAHTSHKTQPLDRSVFSALKSYFRQATKALASFTASAAVNKRRFLYCYRDTSKLGMSARNIISGFRNTGIWPLDPSKVLDDPEAVLESQALPVRPKTPPPEPRTEFWTPQKSQDIRTHQQGVSEGMEASGRLTRTLLAKAGKALDAKNAEMVSLKAQVDHLTKELESHEPQGRKRVKENANDKFTRIEDIIQAKEDSMKSPKKKKKKTQQDSQVVKEAEEIIVRGLETIRQVEEE